jgi:hypothetical protein
VGRFSQRLVPILDARPRSRWLGAAAQRDSPPTFREVEGGLHEHVLRLGALLFALFPAMVEQHVAERLRTR